MAPLAVALAGLGTVGAGVFKLLADRAEALEGRAGRAIRVVAVSARDRGLDRGLDLGGVAWFDDPAAMAREADAEVFVELIGGADGIAKAACEAALDAGRDVVTANKALLANHGREIFEAAERNRVRLGFEASVAGGIPIIRTLRDALAGDRNRAIYGIVNGTCNSILSSMSERGVEFAEALAEAQAAGLAEADPTLDVDGVDAAQKLSLIAMLAFGVVCPVREIFTEGIRHILQLDVAFARELGYEIRLLAIARDDGKTLEARVHPTMIPRDQLLADVRGASNAIRVRGEALGPTMYVGPGAGMMPTATSVVGDLLEFARERSTSGGLVVPALGRPWKTLGRRRVRPIGEIESEVYLRVLVLDRPGVLARIAGILGANHISIASVIQRDRGRRVSVPIIIRTHAARERNLARALADIARLEVVRRRPVAIRIEDNL